VNAIPQISEALAAFQRGELERARMLAQQEVEKEPASSQAQHLLGLIECRSGRVESGVEWLRRASAAEPANLAYRVMLVRALVDCGQAEEALEAARRPTGTSPAELALWHARAEAADAAENVEAAAEAWGRLARNRPSDWRAWSNLGNTLAAQGRWDEAGDALSKAAALNPADLTIRRNAGAALVEAGRVKDAVAHFAAAAAADPEDVDNRILLARALESLQRHDEAVAEFEAAKRLGGESVATELGLGRRFLAQMRFAEAEAALRRAYSIDPTDRAVICQLGFVLERTNQLDALSKLLNDALAGGLGKDELGHLWAVLARREGRLEEARDLLLKSGPNEDPIGWHALMAKIADSMGDSAEAFEAAVTMNRIAREGPAKSIDLEQFQRKADAYREELHKLARTITPKWGAQVPLLMEPSPKRVAFLLGFPRSGTTLLDTFLMGHPEIAVLEEKQLLAAAGQATGQIEDLPTVSNRVLGQARSNYLSALAEEVGGDFDDLVIDKFPLDMTKAPLIHAIFPGAPIIFAQRHPCDVVLSGFMQPFGMVNFSDIGEAADYYDAIMGIWTASRDALPLNVHTVVYEELVENPEAVLKPAVAFLGLEWDARILDHQATARARGTITTPSYDQVTEPLSTRASGRWRRYEEQLEPVLPVLLPWAERLGYGR
jgi:tetratricopeptide (TPR) repeat protein